MGEVVIGQFEAFVVVQRCGFRGWKYCLIHENLRRLYLNERMKEILSFTCPSQQQPVRFNLYYHDGVQCSTNSVSLVLLAPLDMENPTSAMSPLYPTHLP